jgi:hypothetical protein
MLPLRRQVVLETALNLEELQARIPRCIEPHLGPFELVHKLSPGGIVLHLLRTPVTARSFWGRADHEKWHIAQNRRSERVTPYQPLLVGRVVESAGMVRIEGELAPHPKVRTWSWLYVLAGAILLVGGVIKAGSDPAIAAALAALGVLFAVFPHLRAWQGFQMGCGDLLASLEEDFELIEAALPPS